MCHGSAVVRRQSDGELVDSRLEVQRAFSVLATVWKRPQNASIIVALLLPRFFIEGDGAP